MRTEEKTMLIETCLETGPMTAAEIAGALEGTKERKELRAVISLVECFIAEARVEANVRGQEGRIRDEACGAGRYLQDLRRELIEVTRERKAGEAGRREDGG